MPQTRRDRFDLARQRGEVGKRIEPALVVAEHRQRQIVLAHALAAQAQAIRPIAVVGIEETQQLTGRAFQPGIARAARAEIARQLDQLHARTRAGAGECGQRRARDLDAVVGAGVVDHDQLARRFFLRGERRDGLGDPRRLVVERDDDGMAHAATPGPQTPGA